jgi:hypothetical protein
MNDSRKKKILKTNTGFSAPPWHIHTGHKSFKILCIDSFPKQDLSAGIISQQASSPETILLMAHLHDIFWSKWSCTMNLTGPLISHLIVFDFVFGFTEKRNFKAISHIRRKCANSRIWWIRTVLFQVLGEGANFLRHFKYSAKLYSFNRRFRWSRVKKRETSFSSTTDGAL